jgi:hypothetical protein
MNPSKSAVRGLVVISILFAAFQPAAAEATGRHFAKHFSGTINNNLPIEMDLSRNENRVHGWYMYSRIGTPISLEGTAAENGKITLSERNEDGITTGTFTGTLTSEETFTGTWTDPTGNRKFPFLVKENYSRSVRFESREFTRTFTPGGWTDDENFEGPYARVKVSFLHPAQYKDWRSLLALQDEVSEAFFGTPFQGNIPERLAEVGEDFRSTWEQDALSMLEDYDDAGYGAQWELQTSMSVEYNYNHVVSYGIRGYM